MVTRVVKCSSSFKISHNQNEGEPFQCAAENSWKIIQTVCQARNILIILQAKRDISLLGKCYTIILRTYKKEFLPLPSHCHCSNFVDLLDNDGRACWNKGASDVLAL